MKIVTTYTEWIAAIQSEIDKLSAVRIYLSENGKKRLAVMTCLGSLASFCRSAMELVGWIETREGMDQRDSGLLDSDHARPPISWLKKIAAKENRE